MLRLAAFLAAFLALSIGPAMALGVDRPLPDPQQEARALELQKQLRCLVCQNQSISDSNAELAQDLRLLVRERVSAGDTDREVLDYLVARYGEWVLLKPPFKPSTWLLWLGPVLLLLVAGFGARRWMLRQGRAKAAPAAELNAQERERLRELLGPETGH